jgi:AmpD protein
MINPHGWLQDVEIIRSPNYEVRPAAAEIRLLVVHAISLPPGQYGGGYVQQFFTNQLDAQAHAYFDEIKDLKVSAHCLILRDGQLIQFVSFLDRAWHAGASRWKGSENCNDFSIGIELEGCDEEAFDDRQYETLSTLVIALRKQYPAISDQSICAHSDIAPGRKTDPGPFFDWSRLAQLTNNLA